MKIRHIALAALAALAGQAHALTPAQFGAATKVYFSGATATKGAFGGLFTQNCQAATRNDYTLASDASFSTIYTCTLNATNDFGVGAINVVFQKLDFGGSGTGVFPVSRNEATNFIDEATCATPSGTGSATCTGTKSVIPDGGTSDLALYVFNASKNQPAAFAGSSVGTNWVDPDNGAGGTVGSYVQTSFGLGVSASLLAALRTDQGIAAPALPTVNPQAVAQILAKGYQFSTLGWKPLLTNNAVSAGVQGNSITICRRVNGSGTQAAANAFFLNYPFQTPTVEPSDVGDSTGTYIVNESSESSGVRTCLANATGFAIGHLSNESSDSSTAWKFVKIGAQTSGTPTARTGQYTYIYDSFCGYNGAKPASTAKTIATKICGSAASPANLQSLTAAQQNGVMGSPASGGCLADPTNARCSSVWRVDGDPANQVSAY